jgi:hypothetical protein
MYGKNETSQIRFFFMKVELQRGYCARFTLLPPMNYMWPKWLFYCRSGLRRWRWASVLLTGFVRSCEMQARILSTVAPTFWRNNAEGLIILRISLVTNVPQYQIAVQKTRLIYYDIRPKPITSICMNIFYLTNVFNLQELLVNRGTYNSRPFF